jgi:Fic family protein
MVGQDLENISMSFDFDDFDVRSRFNEIDEKTEELEGLLSQLRDERSAFRERCKIAYIYHDGALDGIVLTYHELRAAVDHRVMSDSALIPTYQEIKNQSDALEQIHQRCDEEKSSKSQLRNATITVKQIFDLHILLNRDLPRRHPGVLRTDMPLHRTYFHKISEPELIESGLQEVIEMVSDSDFRTQHPINQAAMFHHKYMEVFPFSHDSGKVGRFLMNYFLIRADYLPAVIHACDRQQYYEALRTGPESLRHLIIESMDGALDAAVRYMTNQLSGVVSRRRVSAGSKR